MKSTCSDCKALIYCVLLTPVLLVIFCSRTVHGFTEIERSLISGKQHIVSINPTDFYEQDSWLWLEVLTLYWYTIQIKILSTCRHFVLGCIHIRRSILCLSIFDRQSPFCLTSVLAVWHVRAGFSWPAWKGWAWAQFSWTRAQFSWTRAQYKSVLLLTMPKHGTQNTTTCTFQSIQEYVD